MIDLAIELDNYGEDKKPNSADWESILDEPRFLGRLSDMQDQGFMMNPSPPEPWIRHIK